MLVFDLAEDLADLVLDGVGTGGGELELAQVGEEGFVGRNRVRSSDPMAAFWSSIVRPSAFLGAAQVSHR